MCKKKASSSCHLHIWAASIHNLPSDTKLFRSAIHLWGRSGRGHCRKVSANCCKISAPFPQNFRTLSWRNKTYFFANFREFSAEFPQTFRENPFANDPISELLIRVAQEPNRNRKPEPSDSFSVKVNQGSVNRGFQTVVRDS